MEDCNSRISNDKAFKEGELLQADYLKLADLYLATCEMLARQAYEATLRQQQQHILSQLSTVENVTFLQTRL